MISGRKQGYVGKFLHGNPLVLWRAALEGLGEDLGTGKTIWSLLAAGCSAIHPGKVSWNPALFPGIKAENHALYRKRFYQLKWLICLYRTLVNEFGEDVAQFLSAKVVFAISVPHLAKTFRSFGQFTDADRFSKCMSDYLGTGTGIRWLEVPNADGRVLNYLFTQCPQVEILNAYGLRSAAAAFCLSDHVVLNHRDSNVTIIRTHCMGVGDHHCSHQYSMRTAGADPNDPELSPDIRKADFNGMRMIRSWKLKTTRL